ncbi:MAG: glycerol-3-phosphate dehydrogenase/oxidase [Anaerolineae bacterium]
MWNRGWRDRVWEQLDRRWDIIVIGGGITGAGILREAARAGLRVLLVEASDFAAGTSSRSGKLVHGGLRYLKNAQIKLTVESVSERERLQREGRGLINSMGFILANFSDDRPPMWVFGAGLVAYDMLALKWAHRQYGPRGIRNLCPQLTGPDLVGGFRYFDAQTDDARLVLRVIREAVRAGGMALNYAHVEQLLFDQAGQVRGVVVRDQGPDGRDRTAEVQATVVINATGAWADELRIKVGGQERLRQLRGGHVIFPWARLPLSRAVTFLHPVDRRALYAFPWEGVTLAGTTDVDHGKGIEIDPRISGAEIDYILTGLARVFPDAGLTRQDIQATFAGVRPVINTGNPDPSKESREFMLWNENGLLTVAGGKLTTFRLMAHDALRAVRPRLPGAPQFDAHMRMLDPVPTDLQVDSLSYAARLRLLGRYGAEASDLQAAAEPGEMMSIASSESLWAELRWAARAEGVTHLDDLLLRRVRLGLVLPQGGQAWMERIRAIVQPELGWDDKRWESEFTAYTRLWHTSYSLPV